MKKTAASQTNDAVDPFNNTIEMAAELFGVLSAPLRLRIIRAVCDSERNVSELLTEIPTTQPNMSKHLHTLYKAGILGKRRDGIQIYYRVIDQRVTDLCHTVCSQMTSTSKK